MGAWSLYFLAKLALYYSHAIGLHWLANLLLAAALAWPLAGRGARRLRGVLAIPIALALLYFDSYLPPFARLVDEAGALSSFRADYLLELLQRFVPLRAALAFAGMVLAYVLLQHRLRFATLAFMGLFIAAVFPAAPPAPPPPDASQYVRAGEPAQDNDAPGALLGAEQLDVALQAFYGAQRGRTVSLRRAGTPSFDLVLLSICSLSDDDLTVTGMTNAPLLGRFDIVFSQFNSAATYSGPAVLRLLHGTCGQTPQGELYSGTSADDCYLFRNLAGAGYRPALLLNHDGHFDHFAQQLASQGGVGADPLDNRAAPVTMTSFDGTPVRSDYALLSQWWNAQEASAVGAGGTVHRALLYNTITLHDGNRVPGMGSAASRDTYAPRLRQLFADLGRFLDLVEQSGRPTVVVLIPEHGAALRGDAMQVSGLRELPSRAITRVPVAVKLVGFAALGTGSRTPVLIDRPSSYLSLSAVIGGLLQVGPSRATPAYLQSLARAVPATEWAAENAGTVLFHQGGRDYLRSPAGSWAEFGTADAH
jgi:cellulose synthase operon protein YhjU